MTAIARASLGAIPETQGLHPVCPICKEEPTVGLYWERNSLGETISFMGQFVNIICKCRPDPVPEFCDTVILPRLLVHMRSRLYVKLRDEFADKHLDLTKDDSFRNLLKLLAKTPWKEDCWGLVGDRAEDLERWPVVDAFRDLATTCPYWFRIARDRLPRRKVSEFLDHFEGILEGQCGTITEKEIPF